MIAKKSITNIPAIHTNRKREGKKEAVGWPEETAKSFIQWEVFSPDSMGDVGNEEVIPAAVFCFHSSKMGSSPIGLAGRNEKKGMASRRKTGSRKAYCIRQDKCLRSIYFAPRRRPVITEIHKLHIKKCMAKADTLSTSFMAGIRQNPPECVDFGWG